MHRRTVSVIAAIGIVAALSFRIGVAVGEQAPPTVNKGINATLSTTLDVSRDFDNLEGRQLRLRLVTIEPGGQVAIHSHKGRPAVAQILSGTLTEHRDAGWVAVRRPGDAWSEGGDVTHWAENLGSENAVVLTADLYKP